MVLTIAFDSVLVILVTICLAINTPTKRTTRIKVLHQAFWVMSVRNTMLSTTPSIWLNSHIGLMVDNKAIGARDKTQHVPLADEETRVADADDDAATYVGLDEIGLVDLISVGLGELVLYKCSMGPVGLEVVGLCPVGMGVVGMALGGKDDVGLNMLYRHCPWYSINIHGAEALLLEPNPGVTVLYRHHPWSNTYIFGMEALLLEPNPGVPVLYPHHPWSNIYILGMEASLLAKPNPGVPVLYQRCFWYSIKYTSTKLLNLLNLLNYLTAMQLSSWVNTMNLIGPVPKDVITEMHF